MCDQVRAPRALTVRWHQLEQRASSLSVISFLLLAKGCWFFPKHVVKEASCVFTFKAGWRPGPDQTATVHSRVWVKTMLLWQRLISDGSSRAGRGCFPSCSSAGSAYLLWHCHMWEIKCGTQTIILGMMEVRAHARSQPWWAVSKSWHKHRSCIWALGKADLCVSSARFPASKYHVI